MLKFRKTNAISSSSHRRSARAATLVAGCVMLVGAAGFAAPAGASTVVGGVQFSTSIDCGGSSMLVATHTPGNTSSYDRIAVYSYTTGQWYYETNWHLGNAYSFARTADFTFRPGYFKVYVYYAQYTTAGWVYSGEGRSPPTRSTPG